jgi:predicted acylesterase/phospholipase RssA
MKKLFFVLILSGVCFQFVAAQTGSRPKIGLVLSGGGAKGFAHAGTLQMLDSLDIPVDFIAGTSIGGIVGALYSIGYSGQELENLAYEINWEEIFTDNPPRKLRPFFERKDDGKYQLELGFKGVKPVPPSGFVTGQKISLLFSELTLSHAHISDFDQLPIPFRCVALDLVTGKEVILKSGTLPRAMRATMSIPTVFSPVDWGDSLLVDGGYINNIPVDVVKAMGADIVIAVNVQTPLLRKNELGSIFGVLNQLINITDLPRVEKNIRDADVVIRPAIGAFSNADFAREKVGLILKAGKIAAQNHLAELVALKTKYQLTRTNAPVDSSRTEKPLRIAGIKILGNTTLPHAYIFQKCGIALNQTFTASQLERNLLKLQNSGTFASISYQIKPVDVDQVDLLIEVKEKQQPLIHGIQITGNQRLPFTFIYRLLGMKPGDRFNKVLLNSRINEMYGLGYFEKIIYEIEPFNEERINLLLAIKEKPIERLRIGIRYDNQYQLVARLSLQRTNFLVPGLRTENELEFAGITRWRNKISYPSRTLNFPVYPFFEFGYQNITRNVFNPAGEKIASYNDQGFEAGIGIGLLFSKFSNLELEYAQENVDADPNIAFPDPLIFPEFKDQLRKIRVTLKIDLLDDILLPREGLSLAAGFEGSYERLKSDLFYNAFHVSAEFYQTFLKRHTLRYSGFYGLGSTAMPVYKYFNQGRPEWFVGLKYDQLTGRELLFGRLDYRLEYKKDIFFKWMANALFRYKYDYKSHISRNKILYGYGFSVELFSALGPLEFIFSRGQTGMMPSEPCRNLFYFIAGYKF